MSYEEFEVIYSYSRQDAIADGVLIDVSKEAKETGFKVSVAVSDHLYRGYVVPTKEMEDEGQSTRGRLHDLLMMANFAARKGKNENRIYFEVLFQTRPENLEKIKCLSIIGPGDYFEPVLTIMLPEDE